MYFLLYIGLLKYQRNVSIDAWSHIDSRCSFVKRHETNFQKAATGKWRLVMNVFWGLVRRTQPSWVLQRKSHSIGQKLFYVLWPFCLHSFFVFWISSAKLIKVLGNSNLPTSIENHKFWLNSVRVNQNVLVFLCCFWEAPQTTFLSRVLSKFITFFVVAFLLLWRRPQALFSG